jgi:hypothetical protein
MLLNAHWQFGNILLLSSNNRISSFYWIRGSKHCFLTSFSNLNRYFLFLVFLCNCYLLVSLGLSWLHGNPISCPVLIPLVLWVPHWTCAPIFLAHMTRFLKARCLWEPGTRISTSFLSPFRLLPKVSCHANVHWAIANHTFSSHVISSNWHFLAWHKPLLSQCSTALARNPQGISKLVNKGWLLLVWQQLLDNFPSALCTCLWYGASQCGAKTLKT